jgi:hypothetical protein
MVIYRKQRMSSKLVTCLEEKEEKEEDIKIIPNLGFFSYIILDIWKWKGL